jgi:hypothetical protein
LEAERSYPLLKFALLILLALVLGFATVLETVVASKWLHLGTDFRPEVQLPLLLIQGLIALVIALTLLVAAFYLFDLTDKKKPFGVPEGTLQVVIALTLILIFAISSLYLRGSFNPTEVTLRSLTAAQVDAIPATQIVGKTKAADGRFDVVRAVPVDQDAKDFSNQLLTILGTLVGAVAGFYFGAKSVETGLTAGGTNVRPSNTSPPIITGDPLVGRTLRAEEGGWTGSPPPSYGYQWRRKRPEDLGARDITGGTNTTYVVTVDDVGHTLSVAVTATNAAGSKPAYSAETQLVLQPPEPPPGGVAVEPGGPQAPLLGTELRAVPGDWAGTPTPSLSYAWERRLPGVEWAPIPGATSQTYVAAPPDVGSTLRVSVTGTSAAGTTTAYSAETPTIVKPEGIPVEGGDNEPTGGPASPAEEPGSSPETDAR